MRKLISALCASLCGIVLLSGCDDISTSQVSDTTSSSETSTSIAASDSLHEDGTGAIEHYGYGTVTVGDWELNFSPDTYTLDVSSLDTDTEKVTVLNYSATLLGNKSELFYISGPHFEIVGPCNENLSDRGSFLATQLACGTGELTMELLHPKSRDATVGTTIPGCFVIPFVGNGDYTISFHVIQLPGFDSFVNLTVPITIAN